MPWNLLGFPKPRNALKGQDRVSQAADSEGAAPRPVASRSAPFCVRHAGLPLYPPPVGASARRLGFWPEGRISPFGVPIARRTYWLSGLVVFVDESAEDGVAGDGRDFRLGGNRPR